MMFKSIATGLVAGLVSLAATAADPASTPLIDKGYQETANANCGSSQLQCVVYFPVATAAVTEITNVSCNATPVESGTQISYAVLNGMNNTSAVLQPFVLGTSTDGSVFSLGLAATTKLFYSTGNAPSIEVGFFNNPGLLTLVCTVSGYIPRK